MYPNNLYLCVMQQALNSKFIINGVPQELTPAGLLAPVLEKAPEYEAPSGTVIDETMDPAPGAIVLEDSLIDDYLKRDRIPKRQPGFRKGSGCFLSPVGSGRQMRRRNGICRWKGETRR